MLKVGRFVDTNAVLEAVVDAESIVAGVRKDSEAGLARSAARSFDATLSPTLFPATIVSPLQKRG